MDLKIRNNRVSRGRRCWRKRSGGGRKVHEGGAGLDGLKMRECVSCERTVDGFDSRFVGDRRVQIGI